MESLEGEEEDGEIKALIQAQMADMQGGENGEKKLSEALYVETHKDCRMSESEGGNGLFGLSECGPHQI